jgi:hypothetical protein
MVAIFKNIVSKETRLKFFVHAINTSILGLLEKNQILRVEHFPRTIFGHGSHAVI